MRVLGDQEAAQQEARDDQQEDRQQRGEDGLHGLRPARRRKPREPVERALQDEDGGVLVDHLGALRAAHVGGDQVALDRGGREPLVPQADRQRGQLGEIARKGARRLRARTFRAVHVDRQAEHEAGRVALGGEREHGVARRP